MKNSKIKSYYSVLLISLIFKKDPFSSKKFKNSSKSHSQALKKKPSLHLVSINIIASLFHICQSGSDMLKYIFHVKKVNTLMQLKMLTQKSLKLSGFQLGQKVFEIKIF